MSFADFTHKSLYQIGRLFPVSGVFVLLYHSIGDRSWNGCVSPHKFEAQLAWIKSEHTPISYQQFRNWKLSGQKLPEKAVMVTFDDGYVDNLELAAPILKKYKVPATLFGLTKVVYQAKYLKNDYPIMNFAQMTQLHTQYNWEIQSHSASHFNLTRLSQVKLKAQLKGSQNRLEQILHNRVDSISYPKGTYNLELIQQVKKYYRFGWTARPGTVTKHTSNYELPRIEVMQNTSIDAFKAHLTQSVNWVQWLSR